MKNLSIIALTLIASLLLTAALPANVHAETPSRTSSTPPVVEGEYTDMRFTEEHAYGYALQLWLYDERPVGLFMASEGLAGDTPTGIIEDVRYDPANGNLSFRARLSIGVTEDGQNNWRPTRDVYDFKGAMYADKVAGILKVSDASKPGVQPRREEVVLKRLDSASASLFLPASYSEWRSWADEILRRRGPRW